MYTVYLAVGAPLGVSSDLGVVHGERHLLILVLVINLGVCPLLVLLLLEQLMQQMVCVRQQQCEHAQKSSWQILLAGEARPCCLGSGRGGGVVGVYWLP